MSHLWIKFLRNLLESHSQQRNSQKTSKNASGRAIDFTAKLEYKKRWTYRPSGLRPRISCDRHRITKSVAFFEQYRNWRESSKPIYDWTFCESCWQRTQILTKGSFKVIKFYATTAGPYTGTGYSSLEGSRRSWVLTTSVTLKSLIVSIRRRGLSSLKFILTESPATLIQFSPKPSFRPSICPLTIHEFLLESKRHYSIV